MRIGGVAMYAVIKRCRQAAAQSGDHHLLGQNQQVEDVGAGTAAVLFRVAEPEQAERTALAVEIAREAIRRFPCVDVRRHFRAYEAPHHFPERAVLVGEIDVVGAHRP